MEESTGQAARAVARLARVLERAAAPLTLQQYRMAAFLAAGGSRATSLAGHLAVTKPSVTAAVDALVAAGYVCREVDPADRRAVHLELSAAGAAALLQTDRAYAVALETVLRELPGGPEVLDALTRVSAELPGPPLPTAVPATAVPATG